MIGHAEITGDYRWLLTRRWGNGSYVLWIGLNPSTADARLDDNTIRRMRGFAERDGHEGIAVANLFPFRTKSPRELFKSTDPLGTAHGGDQGLKRLVDAAKGAEVIVCCWGANERRASDWPDGMWRIADQPREWTLHGRASDVLVALGREGVDVHCLGTTNGGHPRHPLYVKGDTPLEPFDGLRRYPPEKPLELFCVCGHSWADHDHDPEARKYELATLRTNDSNTLWHRPKDLRACNGVVRPQVAWSRDERYGNLRCRCERFELPAPHDYVDGPPRPGRDRPTLRLLDGGDAA